ncbi:MAG: hypothetical protein ACM34K_12510, partial [Bacillota bacterium]
GLKTIIKQGAKMQQQVINQNQVIKRGLTSSSIQIGTINAVKCLERLSKEGVNALDLIGEPANSDDFNKAIDFIEMNFGVPVNDAKVLMIFDLIKEENWSKERLNQTIKHFLKTKKFKDWVIADLFDYGVKLFPYSWYQEQIGKGVKHEEMESYIVNNQVLWKMKDGKELPFERPKPKYIFKGESEIEKAEILEITSEDKMMNVNDLAKIFQNDNKKQFQESIEQQKPIKYFPGSPDYERAKQNFLDDLKNSQDKNNATL